MISHRSIQTLVFQEQTLVFQEQCKLIYPVNLILNKENVSDDQADVLDLSISIESNKFCISVYDKRDNFPFEIVQFVPCSSRDRPGSRFNPGPGTKLAKNRDPGPGPG